ncbi:hypothetical protein BDV95DRAFT_48225 [Massariosphaeria phaeospora]|uniref:Uncharacterized protein n=1 Tax=Massariosphaeria phaeospora TaxID=100035 RepID=A0A7C8I643_9PLEO|nr:hypothetical protein BDV95DRAFT_48225 [Massariosphaeria phaeospora]
MWLPFITVPLGSFALSHRSIASTNPAMASTERHPAWTPSDTSALHFSNCTLAATFVATTLRSSAIPLLLADAFLIDGLSAYLSARGLARPSLGSTMEYMLESNATSSMFAFAEQHCLPDICVRLGWEGNPDIAGVGMLTNYMLQAFLVTLYLPVLLLTRYHDAQGSPCVKRGLLAVQYSTPVFLNASVIFSIAMLLAALYSFARALDEPTLLTYSASTMSMLMSLYSVLPAAALQIAAGCVLRRTRGARLVWSLIAGLVVVVLALYVSVPYLHPDSALTKAVDWSSLRNLDGRLDVDMQWELRCPPFKPFLHVQYFSTAFGSLLVFVLLVCIAISVLVTSRPPSKPSWYDCWPARFRWFRWFSVGAVFVAMWFCLGWFVHFRKGLLRAAGKTNKDLEWSFGQILALATWVPVLAELVYIWKQGPVKALSGLLMHPYKVVEITAGTERVGMSQPNSGLSV